MSTETNIPKKAKSLLTETVHVMKTKPEKDGAIYVFITSDKKGDDKGNVGELANELGISKAFAYKWKYPFDRPVSMKSLTKTPLPGDMYGWGYKITSDMNPLKVNQLIRNLSQLKDDYNRLKTFNLGAGVSQTDDSALIDNIEETLAQSEMKADIPEVKENIEKYLQFLYAKMRSSDPEEVFNYLVDKIESIEEFQENNAAIFYRYAPANALLIKIADPLAIVAAPENIWNKKGYILKPKFKGTWGVPIAGGGDLYAAAKWVIENHWEEIKRQFKLPFNQDKYDFLKRGGKNYDVAAFGRNMGWKVPKDSTGHLNAIYTNTMVEPDPSKDYHEPLPTGSKDEFRVDQPELKSEKQKERVNDLYRSMLEFAQKELTGKAQPDLMGVSAFADGDINKLSSLIFKVARAVIIKSSYSELKGLKTDDEKEEYKNKTNAFAEAAVSGMNKLFKLPSSAFIHNIASHTGKLDDEQIRSGHDLIINTIGKLHNYAKNYIANKAAGKTGEINEIRKIIRKIIFENIKL